MTISLEEHVARAIAPDGPVYWDNGLSEEYKAQWLTCARAAIEVMRGPAWYEYLASIRESERAKCEEIARNLPPGHCYDPVDHGDAIADAIAARKGKGEGK
jgi:hypothetical protein